MFGAALLAKATDSRVDALSLKIRHSPSAYAIRSVAEKGMSPAEWWGSRDAFPGGSQVPGSSSAVTAGSVSRGVWSLAIEASEK